MFFSKLNLNHKYWKLTSKNKTMKAKNYLLAIAAAAAVVTFNSCIKNNPFPGGGSGCGSPDQSEVITTSVEDSMGNMPAGSQTPLYESKLHNPVVAPDGHQVTYGEWSAATGDACVKCINNGTHVILHLNNLIPNGIYTAWTLVLKAPGYNGTEASLDSNLIGAGSLGLNDGSQNVFTASANGTGQITRTVPGGPLSIFGSAGNCLRTDEFEFQFVVLYHIDQMTHGPMPGPDGSKAEQLRFDYKN
jgi:hypothetical protein